MKPGGVAQTVERPAHSRQVVGASPASATTWPERTQAILDASIERSAAEEHEALNMIEWGDRRPLTGT